MRVWPVSLLLAFVSGGTPASAEPGFGDIFDDHMVLQHGEPVDVWGFAESGDRLTVRLDDTTRHVVAYDNGRWQVSFPALPPGGSHVLTLHHGDVEVERVEDVAAGEVWMCAGQSNMEWPVSRSTHGASIVPDADVRLLKVDHDSSPAPLSRFRQQLSWQIADEESLQAFSAVCYFFGERIRRDHDLPVGLIDASWGGSQIEAWIGATALHQFPRFRPQLDLLSHYSDDPDAATRRFADRWMRWWRTVSGGTELWSPETAARWKTVPEVGNWKDYGEPELENHDGMVWFRSDFDIPAPLAGEPARLHLGGIDEVDVTWINGEFIGSEFGWSTPRDYDVPAGVLSGGKNTIVVNVLSSWDVGGMVGPADAIRLEFGQGAMVALGDGWSWRKVPLDYGWPPRAPWESVGGLTGLYNAMIAPIGSFRLAGALFYQGESNAGDGDDYRELLAGMIENWRAQFGDDLPFIVIQLPNFGTPIEAPQESGWAGIRDAQADVALADDNTALVPTIDVGDDDDLHPPHKRVVGQRAAEVANALVYGREGVVDGIHPSRVVRNVMEIVVDFAPVDELTLEGGDEVEGFEVCDRQDCRRVGATLHGNRVLLDAGDGDIDRVRYCWADAPRRCNLYSAGLPVSSFERTVD